MHNQSPRQGSRPRPRDRWFRLGKSSPSMGVIWGTATDLGTIIGTSRNHLWQWFLGIVAHVPRSNHPDLGGQGVCTSWLSAVACASAMYGFQVEFLALISKKKWLQIRHPNISQYGLVSSFFKPAGVYKQHYTTIYIYCKCTSTLTKYVTETGICPILIFVWYLDMAVGFASRHVILTTPIPLCWDEKNPKTPQRRKQCSRKPGKNSWNCLFDLIFGWGLVVLGRDQPFDLWKF